MPPPFAGSSSRCAAYGSGGDRRDIMGTQKIDALTLAATICFFSSVRRWSNRLGGGHGIAPVYQQAGQSIAIRFRQREARGRMVVLWLRRHLQQRVLRALSLGEQRQRLTCDVGLEMRAILMRLEGGFVAEQFVEQKLSRIFLCPRDQEQFCAGLALRLGQEARQDIGDPVGLSFVCFPLRDDQQAATGGDVADGWFVDG